MNEDVKLSHELVIEPVEVSIHNLVQYQTEVGVDQRLHVMVLHYDQVAVVLEVLDADLLLKPLYFETVVQHLLNEREERLEVPNLDKNHALPE